MTEQRYPARERLAAAGLRATKQRVAVLEWLSTHPHAPADAVITGVRENLGSVSIQAVYDVLNACIHAGLVRRIENAGHPAEFETRTRDNHHHLVCRGCGRTEDIDCAAGRAPCLEPSDSSGYDIDEAEVILWGYCLACLSDETAGQATA